MKRGEIWTLQDRNYASKARPVVVIQSDSHNAFDSVILCLFTSFESEGISTRVHVSPSIENGLQKDSYAWLFQNTKKKRSAYNPVVIMKDGESVPADIYKRTKLVKSFKISRN